MRYILLAAIAALCTSCSTAPKSAPTTATATAKSPAPVISRIVYRHQTIVVRAGATGPTYSLETNRGEVLVGEMTLDQIAQKQPEMFRHIRNTEASVWAGVDFDSGF